MTNKSEDPFEKMGNDYLFQDTDEDLTADQKRKKKPGKKKSNKNFWIAAGIMLGAFILIVGVLVVLTMSTLPKIQSARLEQAALINAHNTATVLAATNSIGMAAQAGADTSTPTVEYSPTPEPEIILFSDTPVPETTEGSGVAVLDDSALTATAAALATEATEAAVEETEAVVEETEAPTEETEAATEPEATETTETTMEAAQVSTTAPAATSTTESTPVPTIISTVNPAATATELPETGLADSMGMPGLIGLALALIFVIILARRVRLSN